MSSYAAPQPVNYQPLLDALKASQSLPAGLGAQAQGMANQTVNANVQGIQAQQQQLGLDAAQRAHELGQASLAAAKYLTSLHLPQATAHDYAQSAAAERAAAAGYSGGLQQTVGDAAAHVQANLNRVAPGGQALNVGQQAGNVLYGLGGNLPAAQLDVVGPTVAAGLRALPTQTLAYGQAEAQGALGAGQQDAARLNPSIVAAEAQRATLEAQNLAALQKDYEARGQHAYANILGLFKTQQTDNAAQATAAYRDAEIKKGYASINAADKRSQASTEAANKRAQIQANATSVQNQTQENRYFAQNVGGTFAKDGRPIPFLGNRYNAATGQFEKVPSTSSVANRITPKFTTDVSNQISKWKSGQTGTNNGVPVVDPTQQLTYTQALERAVTMGPQTSQWKRRATSLVNVQYGTPQRIALQAATDAKTGGHGLTSALATILKQQNALPIDFYIPAFARVYGITPQGVRDTAKELSQLLASGQPVG